MACALLNPVTPFSLRPNLTPLTCLWPSQTHGKCPSTHCFVCWAQGFLALRLGLLLLTLPEPPQRHLVLMYISGLQICVFVCLLRWRLRRLKLASNCTTERKILPLESREISMFHCAPRVPLCLTCSRLGIDPEILHMLSKYHVNSANPQMPKSASYPSAFQA